MYINEIIEKIKDNCKGSWMSIPITKDKTRDKILFGDTNKECTGIITTIYPSIDVIKKAHELNANFIICHEAMLS